MGIKKPVQPSALKKVASTRHPTKYNPPDLNADANDVAIETIELAHEGIAPVTDDGKD